MKKSIFLSIIACMLVLSGCKNDGKSSSSSSSSKSSESETTIVSEENEDAQEDENPEDNSNSEKSNDNKTSESKEDDSASVSSANNEDKPIKEAYKPAEKTNDPSADTYAEQAAPEKNNDKVPTEAENETNLPEKIIERTPATEPRAVEPVTEAEPEVITPNDSEPIELPMIPID
ncbi:MAG: hypothetical protein IJM38_07780 [Ruminococcus sp.]|nr:hypothetical protein [Ruminococcus sp.]